jgi:nicotinate-nucleotide adenylyltransferase
MNIGIFGGAFNPVHNGHLHLIDLLTRIAPNQKNIDKLIIVPTANPPHKSSDSLISGEHRINMLKLAVFDDSNYTTQLADKIEISTIEFESEEKSYTYNTLKKFKKMYPNDEFFLFMGSDQFLNFHKWYKYDEIQKLAKISAITRNEKEQELVRQYMLEHKNDVFNAGAMVAKPVVVSSTEIRQRVKNGESIESLVPKAVADYIKENNLYV